MTVTRTLVLWCPDWPVTAAMRAHGGARDAAVALIDRGLVFACSAAARREGVRRGLRLREAQARCPRLLVLPYEAALDHRSFEPVIAAIEQVVPSVQLLRPGTCAIRSRGPSRYYGSEEEAALWLLDVLDAQGIPDARVGIADGPFTAERAARAAGGAAGGPGGDGAGTGTEGTGTRIRIVPEGRSAAFLGPLPVALLDAPELVRLLRRLGVHTLGDFAALSADDVLGRFGPSGAYLHSLAAGMDSRTVLPRTPPAQLECAIEFEPALDRVDQVTFGFLAPAGRFIEKLTAAKLVCTGIRIEVVAESGESFERSWLHPRSFTAADVVDRVRWQLQGGTHLDSAHLGSAHSGRAHSGSGLSSPISRVRVTPENVDAIGNHEAGLWGSGPDERIHHALSRVQSMLGHDGVLTAAIGGGRTLVDRRNLVAWGDRTAVARPAQQPWPGRLPAPAPATVFEVPRPVHVLTADGDAVRLTERGVLTAPPAQFSSAQFSSAQFSETEFSTTEFSTTGQLRQVTAWAGPWPIDERWWDAASARAASRFQIVDSDGAAWLLVLDGEHWWAEARYD